MATVKISDNTTGVHTGTFSGTADAQMSSNNATTNYGGAANLELNKFGTGIDNRPIIRFPGLSNISGPVTVTAATLYVNVDGPNTATNAGNQYSLKRVLRDWVEGEVTWNRWAAGSNWTAGGATDAADAVQTASASQTGFNTGGFKAFSSAQLAQDVEDWINGVAGNFGWVIEHTSAPNDSTYVTVSSRGAIDGVRPALEITYTAAGGGGSPMHAYLQQ